jgi:hypothetical protein
MIPYMEARVGRAGGWEPIASASPSYSRPVITPGSTDGALKWPWRRARSACDGAVTKADFSAARKLRINNARPSAENATGRGGMRVSE